MSVRFVVAAMLVWILCPLAIPADEREPATSSWGITPPNSLQDSGEKRQPAAAAQKDDTPQAFLWFSHEQRERCDGCLQDLRSLFLQTRHYSIQGASCDMAVSAAAFLESIQMVQQNCPEDLLEHSGYTDRIIRNIRYLEKLGNDGCDQSLAPIQAATQAP